MSEYELYGFGESGNAYKAALMLNLCQCDWSLHFVDFFNGGARESSFQTVNPMGEVPVLRHKGQTLTQSGVIQDYLVEQTGQFAPRNDEMRREILRWVIWDNQKMSGYAGPARFLNNFIPVSKKPAGVYEWLSGRLANSCRVLEQHLKQRDWIVDNRPTGADFSCCGYLFYEEPFGFDRAAYPNMDRWLNNIQALEHWAHPYDLMKRAFNGLG